MSVSRIVLAIIIISLLLYFSYTMLGRVHIVYIATTTSIKDTGLLDVIIPRFEEYMAKLGYSVDLRCLAVGSGQAIEMGKRGDVDIIIVHAPDLERKFMNDGYGICRRIIAYNFFIVAGPKNDLLNISNTSTIEEAFRRIFNAGIKGEAKFISRGDNSGTNLKEMEIWRLAGIDPKRYSGGWYIESGKGMGDTLLIAENINGYTLTDISTWLRFRDKLQHLEVLIEASEKLLNVYSVIIVRNTKNIDIAMEFMKFLSREGQEIIGSYGVEKYGQSLFKPISLADNRVLQWIKEMNIDFESSC
ncbi:MAG: substrate-binding domain-containing protein [Candidatus Methanomethylicia archaeon]